MNTALQLDADAVAVSVFFGRAGDIEVYTWLAQVIQTCSAYDLPVVAEMMPPEGRLFQPEAIAHAARIGMEIGADVIKTNYCGNVDAFRQVGSERGLGDTRVQHVPDPRTVEFHVRSRVPKFLDPHAHPLVVHVGQPDGVKHRDHPTIANSIIYYNSAGSIQTQGDAPATIIFSDVQGGWPGQGNIDAAPCFAEPGFRSLNGTPDDPSDDFWFQGDYHLRSEAGRWDPKSLSWVQDVLTSPCIDTGNPDSDWTGEPPPNGACINMGGYGGTLQASKSLSATR